MTDQNQPQDPNRPQPRGQQPPPPPGFGSAPPTPPTQAYPQQTPPTQAYPQQPPTQAYPQGAPAGQQPAQPAQGPPPGYGYGQNPPQAQPYGGAPYGQGPYGQQAGYPMAGQSPSAEGAPRRGRGGKGLAIGISAALVVGLLGGGAVFAYSKLSGGGPQPEEALPASTVAFMKVDLNPSAGQKVDGFRFARKFPELRKQLEGLDENGDLREEVFKAIQKSGDATDLDYEKDIKPWLGDRMAVAAVKDDGGSGPIPVFALAITDQDKAKEGLDKITRAGAATRTRGTARSSRTSRSAVTTRRRSTR